jgi:F-type H+-transporting ATPase subunit alpha
MAVRTEDITALLKQQILNYKPAPSQIDVGEVFEIGDGIALVSGLSSVMAGELVEFPKSGVVGIALNLTAENVGVIMHGRIPAHRRRSLGAAHRAHRFGARR